MSDKVETYTFQCNRCGTTATDWHGPSIKDFAEHHYRLAHGPYAFTTSLVRPPMPRYRPTSRPETARRWSKILRHPFVTEDYQ